MTELKPFNSSCCHYKHETKLGDVELQIYYNREALRGWATPIVILSTLCHSSCAKSFVMTQFNFKKKAEFSEHIKKHIVFHFLTNIYLSHKSN